jgi:hypothetical protein
VGGPENGAEGAGEEDSLHGSESNQALSETRARLDPLRRKNSGQNTETKVRMSIVTHTVHTSRSKSASLLRSSTLITVALVMRVCVEF